jgi:hypothetical protein
MRVEAVREEIRRNCYKDDVQVYGMFVDDGGLVRKRYVGENGTQNAQVIGVYVQGADGFHQRGKPH